MDLASLKAQVDQLPDNERVEAMRLLIELAEKQSIEESRTRFLPFVKRLWPGFIEGKHHEIMASAFERVARGELKRLIINMPPRHTKSEFASKFFPAWYIGQYPDRKIIQASHTAELAVDFGRQTRNIINSEEYQEIFEGVKVASDSKAAGRWNTNKRGTYFAVGVGGVMTGKGADILMIDDPHSEQDAALGQYNPEVYDRVYEWYTSGPRQRLQPGGAIIVIQTRWSKRDLTGQLIKKQIEGDKGGEWEVIQLPAIMPSGEALWPQFWTLGELEALREELPKHKWLAQYQQDPTSEEGALIKRDWWRRWEKTSPPPVEFVLQSWDTAFRKTERSDYSAMTTWGVFYHPDKDGKEQPNLILLDAFKDKMEFPELKRTVKTTYQEWEPDQLIIEAKAAGDPLVHELREMGIPVTDFTPSRGNDKIVRVNSVTDLFASGFVWAPETKWADDVIEECASFPAGEHDDYVDSVSQALMRYRQGGWIRTELDEEEDEYIPEPIEYY